MIFFMVEKSLNVLNMKSQPSLHRDMENDSDNNNVVEIGNDNNNNDDKDPKKPKYKYVKVIVNDPFNNRDIILKVAKKQRGVYLWESLDNKHKPTLHPYFVTGFTDGEGSFIIRVNKNSTHKLNWAVSAIFRIGLHLEDLPLLLSVQKFFGGVGSITKDLKNDLAYFTVNKLDDITNVIIPHFNTYTLLSKKQLDFVLWSKVVNIIKSKRHLTKDGLREIVNIKASLNNGLKPELIATFPDVIPVASPPPQGGGGRGEMDKITKIEPEWLTGFITGDGCFSASTRNNKRKAFRVRFILTQHSYPPSPIPHIFQPQAIKKYEEWGVRVSDLQLLEAIKNYFITPPPAL